MPNSNRHRTYQKALNNLAYMISHRLRGPIATLHGLVELIRLDLEKEELHFMIEKFKMSLCHLDQTTRQLASLIYNEQQCLQKKQRETSQRIYSRKHYHSRLNNHRHYRKELKPLERIRTNHRSVKMPNMHINRVD